MSQPVIGPRYTREEIESAFPTTVVSTAAIVPFPAKAANYGSDNLAGGPPAVLAARGASTTAAAQANLPGHWFDPLPTETKNSLVWALARHLVPHADKPRAEWLPVYAAFQDARLRGATEAEPAALWWCRSSKRCDEADIATSWNSFRPAGPGDSTVGTLIELGTKTGFDFGPWRSAPSADNATTVVIAAKAPTALSDIPAKLEPGAALDLM